MWRAVAAGASVIVAAVSGVVTALVTAHPSLGLWVALGIGVIVGAILQAAVSYYSDRGKAQRVDASGAGAVAVGGSARKIRTRVQGSRAPAAAPGERDGVTASGPGAVGIGGDAAGPISTDVTGGELEQRGDQA
jgi:hypothetical protein